MGRNNLGGKHHLIFLSANMIVACGLRFSLSDEVFSARGATYYYLLYANRLTILVSYVITGAEELTLLVEWVLLRLPF